MSIEPHWTEAFEPTFIALGALCVLAGILPPARAWADRQIQSLWVRREARIAAYYAKQKFVARLKG